MLNQIIYKLLLPFTIAFSLAVAAAPISSAQSTADTYGTGSAPQVVTDSNGVLTCSGTGYWNWHVNHLGNYSEVEWTSNPCNFNIQDRSHCLNVTFFNTRYVYSGFVKRTYLWDRSQCNDTSEIINQGQEWDGYKTTWRTFWSL
jgi:hypothetical protein